MSRVLKIERNVDDQIIDLLKKNIVGTPGKSLVYQHKNVEEKLRYLQDPYFVKLCLKDTLLGVMCLSRRKLRSCNIRETGYYIRYFTFREQFRSNNHKRSTRKDSTGIIRNEIQSIFSGKELDEKEPYFFYAYFDPGNFRSGRIISEFGFKKISTFSVLIFNRLFPKTDKRLQICSESDLNTIRNKLSDFYQDEQLVSFENLFRKGKYFEIREEGDIICSAQAIPDQWKIIELPGLSGKIVLNIFSRIPYLKKLINKNFRFIMFEGIYYKKGREKDLENLFNSILKYYHVNTGILCIDPRSKVYHSLKEIDLGIVNKFLKNISMDVVIRDVQGRTVNPDKPVYISGFDVL